MDFATEPGATTEPDLAGDLGVSSCAPRANPRIDHDSIRALAAVDRLSDSRGEETVEAVEAEIDAPSRHS
jgi:hypothetical protein